MPIINGTSIQRKEKIKAEIDGEVFDTIMDYCTWANIEDIESFLEGAAKFVFAKDRDWKQYKKAKKRAAAALSA